MRLTVSERHLGPTKTVYEWLLLDGPDGIFEASGRCQTLEAVLADVLQARLLFSFEFFAHD
jgi:hypothetical protein